MIHTRNIHMIHTLNIHMIQTVNLHMNHTLNTWYTRWIYMIHTLYVQIIHTVKLTHESHAVLTHESHAVLTHDTHSVHTWYTHAVRSHDINTKLNQSTVSTAKRLASLFWYLIASRIDTLHNTNNGYEIACIWNSKYNVHVCMIQTNADFIFRKLFVFVSCWL